MARLVSLLFFRGGIGRLLPSFALLGGCTELAPGTIEFTTDRLSVADAGPSLAAPDYSRWDCLAPSSDAPATQPIQSVRFTLTFVNAATGAPAHGLQVRACSFEDSECEYPFSAPASPAEDGATIELVLPGGFDGFFEIRARQSIPSLYFPSQPLLHDTVSPTLALLSRESLLSLATYNGVEWDSGDSGVLLVRTYDCRGDLAPGVELTSDTGGRWFTFVGGVPLLGANSTSDEGVSGLVSVPAGPATVEGWHPHDGVLTGRAPVWVRRHWLTYAELSPSALQ